MLGWLALPSFPPLRWSCSVSVGLRFLFPLPFQALPAPDQGCWCVFSPSLFFCVPLLRSRLSIIIHLIFILISSSFPFHPHLHLIARTPPCQRQGVCVERLNRRKTLRIHHIISHYIIYILLQGATGVPGGSAANEDTPGTRENVPACSGFGRQPLKWGP